MKQIVILLVVASFATALIHCTAPASTGETGVVDSLSADTLHLDTLQLDTAGAVAR